MMTLTAITFILAFTSGTLAAPAPQASPKCCFISTTEFDPFSPTSQVCSRTSVSASSNTGSGTATGSNTITYSCPAGTATHNAHSKTFLSYNVPSANVGSSSIAFIAECRDAKGNAIKSKPILCVAGQNAKEVDWDASVMGSQSCVETTENPFRLVQFTSKTAGLTC